MKRVKLQISASKNPLFEKWLLEWKMNAAEQNSELQYSLGKALRSLQKYPFQLQTGKECIILEHFGKKICEMLDKKLEDYLKNGSILKDSGKILSSDLTSCAANMISMAPSDDLIDDGTTSTKRKTTKTRRVSNSDASSQSSQKLGVPAKSVYIPKYRSGAYAILVALYNSRQGKEPMTMASLKKEAQAWCDSSFTRAEPGSFYTAWSSIATLTKKKLVTKEGKPVKYQLTEEGLALAEQLVSLSEEDIQIFSADTPPLSPRLNNGISQTAGSNRSSISLSGHLTAPSAFNDWPSQRFNDYDFCTNTNSTPHSFSFSKQPLLSGALHIGDRKEKSQSVIGSTTNSLPLLPYSSSDENSYLSIFNPDLASSRHLQASSAMANPDHTTTLYSGSSAVQPSTSSVFRRNLTTSNGTENSSSSFTVKKATHTTTLPSSSTTFESFSKDSFCEKFDSYDPAANLFASSSGVFSGNFPSCGTAFEGANVPTISSEEFTEPHETVFLFPGQFKIILLVDIHETEQRGKERSAASVDHLRRLGVLCEIRHLSVGDFLWIARDSGGVELTLPYVIERKRMDDLATSIKDGRFHEQKFRLKGSGMQNLIYLVENYGSKQRLGLPHETLHQAAVNTQVVDQFIVKYSKSHQDSMLYLSCMTQLIIRIFKVKTLMSCPKKNLVKQEVSSDLQTLMTFKEFNKDSTKIRNFTVKEMFLKQLIQLKGMSVDKAVALTDRYPTPLLLIDALKNGGEKVLSDISIGPLRRLGPVLSKSITQLYTQPSIQ